MKPQSVVAPTESAVVSLDVPNGPGVRPVSRSKFFLLLSVVFLAVAITGFSTTFFIPLARGAFDAPIVVHVHGLLLFSWLLLLIGQSSLVMGRQLRLHRRLGFVGAGLAAAVVVSGVLVGVHATRRDLALGADDFVVGQFTNILIEMAIFGGLVAAAVALRRDGESHKRLLMLATISALAPAWLRFRHLLPEVANPFVVFSIVADSMVLLIVARDRIALGRVHPVYVYAGTAMVVIHAIELLAITSTPWLWLSRTLLGE